MMKYYKDTEAGEVYAYSQSDVDAASGIAPLEADLKSAKAALGKLTEPPEFVPEYDENGELMNVDEHAEDRDAYKQAQMAVQKALDALRAIPDVFFDIRHRLRFLDPMTQEEVDAHLNPPREPAYKTRFSVLEFRDRFTLEEKIAIRQAQFEDMEVGLIYDELQAAQFIDIEDPRVAAGLEVYVSKGLLKPQRKLELLESI